MTIFDMCVMPDQNEKFVGASLNDHRRYPVEKSVCTRRFDFPMGSSNAVESSTPILYDAQSSHINSYCTLHHHDHDKIIMTRCFNEIKKKEID